jgi:hypothetical protein
MKKMLFVLLACFLGSAIMAQSCDKLVADLKKGTLNGLKPTATQEQVKAKLPCFTGDSEDGGAFNCGGGVFFLDNDFFCYTGRDYIELRTKFNGKLSIPVLGLTKAAAIKKLGMGRAVRTEKDEDTEFLFFKTAYGCLMLKIENSKVANVAMYAIPAKEAELCL